MCLCLIIHWTSIPMIWFHLAEFESLLIVSVQWWGQRFYSSKSFYHFSGRLTHPKAKEAVWEASLPKLSAWKQTKWSDNDSSPNGLFGFWINIGLYHFLSMGNEKKEKDEKKKQTWCCPTSKVIWEVFVLFFLTYLHFRLVHVLRWAGMLFFALLRHLKLSFLLFPIVAVCLKYFRGVVCSLGYFDSPPP